MWHKTVPEGMMDTGFTFSLETVVVYQNMGMLNCAPEHWTTLSGDATLRYRSTQFICISVIFLCDAFPLCLQYKVKMCM
jgi:hypothetical protein